jgi:gamma-glutamylputrescine oxidase
LRSHIKTAAPITHRWAGLVGYTNDGKPIGEELRPGVFVIGGYNGTGNIVGTIYGKKAAKWA